MSAIVTAFRILPRTRDPRGESSFARACRWFADRQRLRELESRLLRDIGLTPEDVARGVPFAPRRR